jgi:hypothetical protein
MNVEKLISPLISSQFPSFYQEEGPNFIAFVKAYYEWAEQQNNFINLSRSIYDIKALDTTTNTFVKYFKNKYISSLPESIIADKKLLVKHILELYRSKGTKRSYELLFRMFFNEEISVYIPSDYIFKPSEALWYIPYYIEVSDSIFLPQLIGRKIYSKKDGFATVENFFIKIVNNKTINVLILSGIEGSFNFNEQIYCDDFPEITAQNAPIIFGSLSSISITNGGSNYNVGDLLNINAGGEGGIARVASTKIENGKAEFTLVDGGHGFSVNAIVSVTGGYGAGASFQVGGITNKQVYQIVSDKISSYLNTAIEDPAAGVQLNISNLTGPYINGEQINSVANTRALDVQQLYSTAANGESFSNTYLGISNLVAYKIDGNTIYVTGSDSNLTNANLVSGAVLISNSSSALISVKRVSNKVHNVANGIIVTSNTSVAIVNQINGNFIPSARIIGTQFGDIYSYTATINTQTRLTDWMFPYASAIGKLSNLDTKLSDLLTIKNFEVGTITYLKNINPGVGYSSNPAVSVLEPDIYDLRINDGKGGYYGYDAIITTKASSANGIVTAVEVVDSGYGYNPNETIYLSSLTNQVVVSGVTVVDGSGKGSGYWKNNKSFTSDTINIQDSYYYQNFSYEIVASRMMETYEKYVKDLIHPSGMQMFGKYALTSYLTDNYTIPESFSISQS